MSAHRYVSLALLLVSSVGLSLLTEQARAQEVTAAVVGTVTDQSGAPIKDADVTATDTDRGTVWSAKTNDAGAYNLPRLPVGNYSVKVSAAGFQTALRPPFTLVLNQTARVDMQMRVGQVSETVEVSAAAPVLQTDSTQVSTVIDSVTNDRLPLATRNYVELTLLSPGSVSPSPDTFNNGDNTASGGRPYINGNREQANNFILDGLDNNQVSDNLLGYTPAPDAIQEFNLITQNASAEFGNYMGGIVSTTIKSGTNDFHGDLWEYFRNDKLNANSWQNGFTPSANGGFTPRNTVRWNMFGGTIGGPVVKNKLFFFFDYQGQRFDHPATARGINVFTASERNGDFSGISQQLYNPCAPGTGGSGTPCTPNPAGPQPFPNNQIPLSMLDPVAKALFASSLYPTAVGTNDVGNNAYNIQTQQFNTNQFDIKMDYNASGKDHLAGRYSHAHQSNPTINSDAIFGTGFSEAPINSEVVDWSHTFSSTLLNDLRLGVNHVVLHNGTQFSKSVGNLGTQLGIANANANAPGLLLLGFGGGTPSAPGNGTLSNVGSSGVIQSFKDAVIQASDAVVITRNHHVFHTGFEFWRDRINTFYTGNSGELGAIVFTGQYTSSNPAVTKATGGFPGADFFLGLPTNYGLGIAGGEWGQRSSILAGYLQDDWHATPTLTVNMGLRYEVHTPWLEIHDRQDNFGLVSGVLLAPNCSRVNVGTAPISCQNSQRGLYNGNYGPRNLQPRLGFAWAPHALENKTVIRGAFGVSSYLEGTGTNLRLPINPPFSAKETFQQYTGTLVPGTSTDQGIAPVGSASDPFAGALIRVWDPNVQPAITYQWNGTFEQRLAGNMTLQVGYVGQHGTHLMVPMPYLQKQLLPASACGTPPCTAPSVFLSGNPAFQKDISQISGTASVGSMRYDALQTVLQKRVSQGLEYQVAYTFSRCMTDNSGYYGTWGDTQGSPSSPYYQNLYNPRGDWAPCFFDAKHIISAYATYEIPFGRGKKYGGNSSGVINAVAGGWAVNPLVLWHTGFPLALRYGGADATGSRGLRPDCNGPSHVFGRQPAFSNGAFIGYQWFDPSPYSAPANNFGTCPAEGPLRGPGYVDLDFSLQKNFLITERVRLQLRSDFINAFNHTNLDSPNTNLGAGMGLINGAQNPRNIQFALKLYY
ncbi:MAG: carboxypeptidase regulatory-like domain-containing protein [Acidobacteria bacterium]|nr:carboxypeptidase regulatory-like domain-containing protein [Acidobacteriota bacterium]